MNKNLKVIQTVFKVVNIVSKVLMVFSIVAAALSAVGLICFAAGVTDSINWGNVTIHGLISNETNLADGQMYALLCDSIIMGAAAAVVMGFVSKYCKSEVAAGTPFTHKGSKQMLVLGIITLAVMVGAKLFASIVCGIICSLMNCEYQYLTGVEVSLSFGLLFILLSFVFAYGADVTQGNQTSEEPPAQAPTQAAEEPAVFPADLPSQEPATPSDQTPRNDDGNVL